GKLQEVPWIPQRPVTYPGQNVVNIGVLAIAVALGVAVALYPGAPWAPQAFLGIAALALIFGVLLIIPIGGADMPTVISILNAYAGLSAAAMGFVLDSKLLVTSGGRAYARPQERAAGRSEHSLLGIGGGGRDQPRDAADRRRAGARRERRRESGGALQQRHAHLRHADRRRRQGEDGAGGEAQQE